MKGRAYLKGALISFINFSLKMTLYYFFCISIEHEGKQIAGTVSIPESPIHFLRLKVSENVWHFLSVLGNFPVRHHNPVAADINVRDSCFCSFLYQLVLAIKWK